MDPLSDVLSLLNVASVLSARLETGGRWALRFPGYRHVKFGVVYSGSCWITVDGAGEPVQLAEGDCYLLAVVGACVRRTHLRDLANPIRLTGWTVAGVTSSSLSRGSVCSWPHGLSSCWTRSCGWDATPSAVPAVPRAWLGALNGTTPMRTGKPTSKQRGSNPVSA